MKKLWFVTVTRYYESDMFSGAKETRSLDEIGAPVFYAVQASTAKAAEKQALTQARAEFAQCFMLGARAETLTRAKIQALCEAADYWHRCIGAKALHTSADIHFASLIYFDCFRWIERDVMKMFAVS